MSFTGSRNGLSFVHLGRATTFRITLSAQGPRSAPAVFQSAPLPIGAGKTARIRGIRWASLVGSALRVSVGGRTLTVRNRFRPARLASISSLRVTKLRTRTASLTIRVALRKLPVGSQLAFAWVVRRSRRVVTTHGLLAPAGTKAASFTFHAKRAGRYTLKAIVSSDDGKLTLLE